MTDTAIRCEGLAKQYRIGEREPYRTLRDAIANAFTSPRRLLSSAARNSSNGREDLNFWALKDISFELKRAEVLGIIGRNGAGKSTLLKVLSRITEPTCGHADTWGRVGSLLEVGTGFHPELTGRDNIFLNGAILGMRRFEIARKFDEIVAFAEVERFIDTPVKRYSSGMYVRLAFAVAAHLEPEILFVDEVLSVGDAAFQKKCLGKMSDVARQGRAIVFVSHNMTAVQSLCDRVLWLDKGLVRQDGPAGSVMSAYLAQTLQHVGEFFWPDPKDAPGNDVVRIRKARVRPENHKGTVSSEPELITVRTPLVLEFEYWVLQELRLSLSLVVFSEDGSRAFNTFPQCEPELLPVGLFRTCCHIPGDLLNDGNYRIQLIVVKDQSEEVFNIEDALVFEVHDARLVNVRWHGKIRGAVRPMLDWTTEPVHQSKLDPVQQVSVD
jgi:lipopolysaccharide transport system ATP-binding protein